jgi:hypothetical protein
MFRHLFGMAMRSRGRQLTLRRTVAVHLLLLLVGAKALDAWGTPWTSPRYLGQTLLGQFLLVAGIVEGAILLGWRLTQIPKSQSLEFLLVTPQRPGAVLFGEALVGLGRLALVTFSGLPVLLLMVADRQLLLADIPVLLIMPFTWGAITGLGLTMWAYEPLGVRRFSERLIFLGIIIYLGIGVLAVQHIRSAPGWLLWSFHAFHHYNPFGMMQSWMWLESNYLLGVPARVLEDRMFWLEAAMLPVIGLLLVRTALRLKGHFHEEHYRPAVDPTAGNRGTVGERPLSWWAVRRVTRYAGKANIWLAWGISIVYALHTIVIGWLRQWPTNEGNPVFAVLDRAQVHRLLYELGSYLNTPVFAIFEVSLGGIPALSAALVVLAAVPAAWQYGLWDSNVMERCRRLELLLLTEVTAVDYWNAATAAAWKRGRSYFGAAALLWFAAYLAGKASGPQVLLAAASGVLLWSLYFALGFRTFSRGVHANGIGSFLTLAVPGLTYALYKAGWPELGALLPPGSIYHALTQAASLTWLIGPVIAGVAALAISRHALAHCDAELRRWYDENHGKKTPD